MFFFLFLTDSFGFVDSLKISVSFFNLTCCSSASSIDKSLLKFFYCFKLMKIMFYLFSYYLFYKLNHLYWVYFPFLQFCSIQVWLLHSENLLKTKKQQTFDLCLKTFFQLCIQSLLFVFLLVFQLFLFVSQKIFLRENMQT